MKKDTQLVQCELINENIRIVVWLDAQKAKLGHYVLSNDVFEKEELKWWKINSVGSQKHSYESIAGTKSDAIWNTQPIKKGNK